MGLKKTLPLFSYVFHPIFITVYGSLFFFFIDQKYLFSQTFYYLMFQICILTIFLPLSLYYLFVNLKLINSFTEASLKERTKPLLINIALLILLLKFSSSITYFPPLYFYILGGLLSTLIALFFVLVKFKASLHMIGICSFTTFIASLSINYQTPLLHTIAFFIICCGLVASSRLYMKSHTNFELIIGALIGIFCQIIFWQFWL